MSEFNSMPDNYSEYERNLLMKITEYPDVINQATIDLTPHIICTYLYELAQTFNRFYENSRVAGDEREQIRLYIVMAYAAILANGLTVLGVPTPVRM
jgi:arginyl-tRNA synthetase